MHSHYHGNALKIAALLIAVRAARSSINVFKGSVRGSGHAWGVHQCDSALTHPVLTFSCDLFLSTVIVNCSNRCMTVTMHSWISWLYAHFERYKNVWYRCFYLIIHELLLFTSTDILQIRIWLTAWNLTWGCTYLCLPMTHWRYTFSEKALPDLQLASKCACSLYTVLSLSCSFQVFFIL